VAFNSSQSYIGIQYGYIVVPSDVDRSSFVHQCYRWERVSIIIERGGGVIHECYITHAAIKDVEFPLTSEQLGTCVVFFTDPQSGHPIIFGTVSKEDESQLLKENSFKLAKNFNGDIVSISGDAEKGVLNLSVSGGTLSELNIAVVNANKTAKVNIRCNGHIIINTSGNVDISAGNIFLGGNVGVVTAPGLPPGSAIPDVSFLKVATKLKTE
jgi:hypothetical protein